MNKPLRLFASILILMLFTSFQVLAAGFDLEVGINTTNPNPAIYSNVPITVTATNTGDQPGTGIQIRLLVCGLDVGSFVQQAGLVYATTGTASFGTWDYINQRWDIPNLAPGQTATLNFTLFALTTQPRSISVFAQAANTPDVDSTPNAPTVVNNVWGCFDNQDDEAVLDLNGGTSPACAIAPTVSGITCNDNGTPSVISDDRFSFTVNATNAIASTGYQLFLPQTSQAFNGTYGSPLNIQNVPISTGDLTLNFTDNMSGNCSATASVTAPAPCSTGGQLPDLNGILHEDIPAENGCYTNPGQNYLVYSMQINNTGSVAAGAFKVKFYFSLDNSLSANDVLWSTVNVPSLGVLQPNGPVFVSPNQPVPASLAPNVYHVIVVIDADSQVAESNEANNIIPPSPVNIGAPDLSLDSYSGLPSTVAAGSNFPVQVTLKYLSNGFPQPANFGFAAQIFLADVTPPVLVGSVNYTVADFAQSSTVTKTVNVNLPANTATGSRYFHITAEYNFCQNPTNQSLYQSVNVTPATGSGIDLELAMQQNTANPVIYSNYTTTLTLVNKGPQAATGVKVKWAKPAGVVYTGGNEFTASQGSFNPNGDQVWTVGSVPANGSATLTVRY
ncbi:MAG: hypothetical protein MUC59_18095, partial [Saprospiraceae bacterium]|nr:hypothetical protein [Saprospiraceae bacterium]